MDTITPELLDALLVVCRKHDVAAIEVGGLKVEFNVLGTVAGEFDEDDDDGHPRDVLDAYDRATRGD